MLLLKTSVVKKSFCIVTTIKITIHSSKVKQAANKLIIFF